MAIINPLPYTIANGEPVDATPVMADMNQIVSNVNANAAPVAGSASQEFLVATTTNPAGAVPLLQAQQQFAALNGSASQVFATAAGSGNDAVPYTQMQAYVGAVAAPLAGSPAQTFAVAPAAASIDAPQTAQILGAGATNYVEQTGARAVGTVYTNTTGRPLCVVIMLSMPAGSYGVLVNSPITVFYDQIINFGTTGVNMNLKAIIPPTGTYFVQNTGVSVLHWYEY